MVKPDAREFEHTLSRGTVHGVDTEFPRDTGAIMPGLDDARLVAHRPVEPVQAPACTGDAEPNLVHNESSHILI